MADELLAMLMVEKGMSDVSVVPLSEPPYVFGKSAQVDVVVDNPFASRRHCEIVHRNGALFIRDMGSKNGTYLNGVLLKKGELQSLSNGDRIDLGKDQVVFKFQNWGTTLTLAPIPQSVGSELRVDSRSREVWIRGQKADPPFARKEFDILELLYVHRGEARSKDHIAVAGWPERDDVSDQDIEQCVRRIRLRIEPDASRPQYLLNIRGYGYKLVQI